jgi:hypothetical protein
MKLLERWDQEQPASMCSAEMVVDLIDHIIKTAGLDYIIRVFKKAEEIT